MLPIDPNLAINIVFLVIALISGGYGIYKYFASKNFVNIEVKQSPYWLMSLGHKDIVIDDIDVNIFNNGDKPINIKSIGYLMNDNKQIRDFETSQIRNNRVLPTKVEAAEYITIFIIRSTIVRPNDIQYIVVTDSVRHTYKSKEFPLRNLVKPTDK